MKRNHNADDNDIVEEQSLYEVERQKEKRRKDLEKKKKDKFKYSGKKKGFDDESDF